MPATMGTGQVWKFPVHGLRATAFCRVVLEMKKLELDPDSPLAFVQHCELLQVSKRRKLADRMFTKANLLHDGTFVLRDGPWKNHGFEYVCDSPVSFDEVEMPCTFCFKHVEKSRFRCQFSRGECVTSESEVAREELDAKWGPCYLSIKSPASFVEDYVVSDKAVRFVRPLGYCDARYHKRAAELLRENNVDLSVHYCDLLPPERRLIYERAIAFSPNRR